MDSQVSFFEGANKLKITKPIRLIELFAGIGAQAKALENLGVALEHYRICEFDKYAVMSYNAIHGTDFEPSDITQITADDLGVTDTDEYCYIMTYSFPCQDLSNAGLKRGMKQGTRSGLLWEVERVLNEMTEKPQILLMENVPQVIGQKNIADFAEWVNVLERMGYKNKWAILNAKDYGVPQTRARCFMVSWQGDYYYDFPEKRPLAECFADRLDKEVDASYYLTDQTVEVNEKHYQRHKELGHGFGWNPIPCGEAATHTHTHTRRYAPTLLTKRDRQASIYIALPVHRKIP